MSAKYTFAVYETIVGSAKEKLVLLKLADNANDSGLCWPGMEYLCKHTELSRSSLMRALKSLEEKQLIKVTRRKSNDGKQNLSNVYQITLPSVTMVLPSYQDDTTPSVTMTPEPNNNKPNNKPSTSNALAIKVIDLWNSVKSTQKTNWQGCEAATNKRVTLTNKRIELVRKRLTDSGKEPTDEHVMLWFTGFLTTMAADPFYSGKQNNYKLEYGQFMAEDYFVKTIERLNDE